MPPPKSSLAANKAILSLFLDGPDSLANIRKRLRREYGDARWSRSIVSSTVPSLVEQGHLRLIEQGEKTADNIYEATTKGVKEFRRWIQEFPRAPTPVREPLQLWIEHSTRDELPMLLAVIRESEQAALREVDEAQRRLNNERMLGRLGPADGSDWPGHMRYVIHSDRVMYWQYQVTRCTRLRKLLNGDRNQHRPISTEEAREHG
jgi:DNA-binding PadR family transcriptional regulator